MFQWSDSSRCLILASALTLVLGHSSVLAADEVDDLFSRGQKAFEETRYSDAERHFEAAFAKRKSADIAANLAQAEIELGKKREAANHLVYAMRFLPASAPENVKAEMQSALDRLTKDLGELRVTVNVSGATISVGPEVVGTSPLEDPIYVEPGPVEVRAQLAGHEAALKSEVTTAGKPTNSTLVLKPTGSGVSGGGDKPTWPAILLGTAGGVFALGGAGLLAGAFVTQSNAEGQAPDGACTPGAAICAEVGSQLDTANTLGALGFVGIGVGVVSLAGLVIYLAWPSDEPRNAPVSLRISPNGLVLEGSF